MSQYKYEKRQKLEEMMEKAQEKRDQGQGIVKR